MKIRFGLVLALALGVSVSGCASGGGGGNTGSPVAGATPGGGGAGISPRNTDDTRAAQSAIGAAEDASDPAEARTYYESALASAEAAIAEDPMNPLAYRLAGIAALGVDDFEGAAAHFDRAVELRPLYEFDLVGIREGAWIDQYQEATPYVQSGDYETAARYFENANAIYRQRPEAMITLGQIYAQMRDHDRALANLDAALVFEASDAMSAVDSTTAAGWMESIEGVPMLRAQVLADAGRFEEAVGTYREMSAANPDDIELKRGLAAILSEMGNEAEAIALYEEMLGMPGLSAADYFAIGVGFYQNNDYARAVRGFSGAATASVNDRDAIEMWARSLQLDSAYAAIPPVAERWIMLDPNSQNAYLIMAQAANQNGDQAATQRAIQAVDGLDVVVNDLQLRRTPGGGATVAGSVVNKKLDPGASVSLRFTFYADDGSPLGTVDQTVSVGAANMAEVVRVEFDSTQNVGGYGYTLTGG